MQCKCQTCVPVSCVFLPIVPSMSIFGFPVSVPHLFPWILIELLLTCFCSPRLRSLLFKPNVSSVLCSALYVFLFEFLPAPCTLLFWLLKMVLSLFHVLLVSSHLVPQKCDRTPNQKDDCCWRPAVAFAAGRLEVGEICGGIPRACQPGELAQRHSRCVFSAGAQWRDYPLRSSHEWFPPDRAD